ncbi:serine/threonine-protein kinase [Actinocorallia aurantiaca]|uniref:Protein kinase domain-containing protein n=1 Tax=Actinocorallia aurantiaca TaxID=46204 RepID=A0ABN3UUQ9_9ACTN
MNPLAPRDPQEIDGHRLLGRLGEGGQGVVYLAEAPDGRKVAVKVLHGGLDGAFKREVSAARKVAPFCTAQVLEVGDDYVVTEFIDGPSLRDAVEEDGPLAGAALYRLSVGTATALAAIHQAGIVHRDFKPGNVLLGPDGPRVIDFGIARHADATASVSGSIVGTPSYMAPEQFSTRSVTSAADVFAWAATIAYAANGNPPYGQDSIPAVMHRLLTAEPDLGLIDQPLRGLLARCLAKEPEARPSARDVLISLLENTGPGVDALALGRATAVEASLDDDRTVRWTTLRLTPYTEPGRRRRSRKLPFVAAVAAGVLVAGGGGIALVQLSGDRSTDSLAASTTPESSADFAKAVETAVVGAKTANVKVEGGLENSLEQLEAEGRLDHGNGRKTNYDVSVSNPAAPDESINPRRLMLIGDEAYSQEIGWGSKQVGDFLSHKGDPYLDLLLLNRWVSSPQNLVALLRNTTSFTHTKDQATWTLSGEAQGASLAEDPAVGAFYEGTGGSGLTVSFTILLSAGHLPRSLDLNLRTAVNGGETFYKSFYKVAYDGWGTSGTIAKPY